MPTWLLSHFSSCLSSQIFFRFWRFLNFFRAQFACEFAAVCSPKTLPRPFVRPSVCLLRPAHPSVLLLVRPFAVLRPHARAFYCTTATCQLAACLHPPPLSPLPSPHNPQLEAHPLHCRRRSGLVQFFFHFLCAVNNFCSVYFFRVGRRRRRCFFQTLIVVACPFAHSSTASSSSASRSCYFSCCCRCCCCFSGVNCTPHVFTPAAKGHPSAYVCAHVRVYVCMSVATEV